MCLLATKLLAALLERPKTEEEEGGGVEAAYSLERRALRETIYYGRIM